jgi:hypothetical protein
MVALYIIYIRFPLHPFTTETPHAEFSTIEHDTQFSFGIHFENEFCFVFAKKSVHNAMGITMKLLTLAP